MAQYTTNQEAMAHGATKVDEAAMQIQSLLGQLGSEVDTMMAGWRGSAASAFLQVHEAFDEQANRINDALRRMYEALLATHRTYATQETTQAQTFAGLAGRING